MGALCKTLPSALRFAEVMDEPYKARGSLEQILLRGGEGQTHVTFAKLAECAAWRDGTAAKAVVWGLRSYCAMAGWLDRSTQKAWEEEAANGWRNR